MTARTRKPSGPAPRARAGHSRQRQRLIEACISALHIHGPSRTTVEKVVAIAKMSPGIVRFYFDSKAEMLVASLQFLAAEFEDRLLLPVARLKATPVAALELMVDLYLDPDIASPRKVSVWYAFWGEASSRQEYYDICGQKDESFAALVRELIETLILATGQRHLDPDGVALGLIGALEMLWQDFAFRTERSIDRRAAKQRCMAYLRSVFPAEFAATTAGGSAAAPPPAAAGAERLPGLAYADARLHAVERQRLFAPSWSVVGHESQLVAEGSFLAIDTGADRVLVVRGADGWLHALRNSCPAAPHALVAAGEGRFADGIECRAHHRRFALDGRPLAGAEEEAPPGLDHPRRSESGLESLELRSLAGLVLVRTAAPGAVDSTPGELPDADVPDGLMRIHMGELPVAADWKIVVEQWLSMPTRIDPAPPSGTAGDAVAWDAAPQPTAWSEHRYRSLMQCTARRPWRRHFLWPNQILETRADGLSLIQAVPTAPGRCVLRRQDYTVLPPADAARAVAFLARRLGPYTRRATGALAESIQAGIVGFGYGAGVASPLAAWFRRRLVARIPALQAQFTILRTGPTTDRETSP